MAEGDSYMHPPVDAPQRALQEVVLRCAAHCQGGHSEAGAAVAKLFGIPFPLTMPSLCAAACRLGFDPTHIYPWYTR